MGAVLQGCYELRDADKEFWYRVIYARIEGVIYILHCFTKKTNKTPQNDINTTDKRLKNLKQRLAKEKSKKR